MKTKMTQLNVAGVTFQMRKCIKNWFVQTQEKNQKGLIKSKMDICDFVPIVKMIIKSILTLLLDNHGLQCLPGTYVYINY